MKGDERSHEPTAPARSAAGSHGDAPPPRPPRELPPADGRLTPEPRLFEHEGRQWVATVAGKGACGTGSYGLGLLEAVHFADAAAPDTPLREALVARGRFQTLFEAELAVLLQTATPITGLDRP